MLRVTELLTPRPKAVLGRALPSAFFGPGHLGSLRWEKAQGLNRQPPPRPHHGSRMGALLSLGADPRDSSLRVVQEKRLRRVSMSRGTGGLLPGPSCPLRVLCGRCSLAGPMAQASAGFLQNLAFLRRAKRLLEIREGMQKGLGRRCPRKAAC